MPANFKKFDVKHGLSVNGLEFVDANRNVTLNNLTVQGTSTVVDTRTVTAVDPIISLGTSGKTYTITEVSIGTPGRLKFSAEAFDDIAVGDSFKYARSGGTQDATPLVSESIYYVVSKDSDVNSSNYRTITFDSNQGGSAAAISNAGNGTQQITLNPLRDLGQDLGIEFNYVESSTAKKGFFGYDDDRGRFTFLTDTTYRGQSNQSDDGTPNAPDFIGTKSGAEFGYVKLEPTAALTANQSAIDIDQTWNDTGVTFKAIEVDVVDTDSAAASSLLDVAVDSNQKLLLRKDGALALNTGTIAGLLSLDKGSSAETVLVNGVATWNAGGSTFKGINLDITSTAYAAGSKLVQIATNSAGDFDIDVTGEINTSQVWNDSGTTFTGIDLQVTDTNSAAASKLVNFFSTANRYFAIDRIGQVDSEVTFLGGGVQTALKVNVTDTSSNAASLLLDLQVGDSSKFSVGKDGSVTVNGTGSFEDSITIQSQPNGTGTYSDSTELQSSTATISAGSSAATNVNSFTASSFTTAKLLVQVKQGSNIHSTELMLVHDGTDVYMTEYGTVYNSDIIVTFDAIVTGGNVEVRLTKTAAAITANSLATVKVTRTAIAS
jgi:hypothetical protein